MTTQEILAMPAGREMDILIATKVFGRPVCTREEAVKLSNATRPHDDSLLAKCWTPWDGYYSQKDYFDGKPEHGLEFVPGYSRFIEFAWDVVEKLIASNPFWEEQNCLNVELVPTNPPGWMCNFGDDTTRGFGETAPLAICRAALIICTLEKT